MTGVLTFVAIASGIWLINYSLISATTPVKVIFHNLKTTSKIDLKNL